MALKYKGQRPPHTEACRSRFEKLWAEDDSAQARTKDEEYRLRHNLPPRQDAEPEAMDEDDPLADLGVNPAAIGADRSTQGVPGAAPQQQQQQHQQQPQQQQQHAPGTAGTAGEPLTKKVRLEDAGGPAIGGQGGGDGHAGSAIGDPGL